MASNPEQGEILLTELQVRAATGCEALAEERGGKSGAGSGPGGSLAAAAPLTR